MRYFALILGFGLALFNAACGTNNSLTSSTSASGAWTDSLTSSTGQSLGTVAFTITQSGTTIQGVNMNFSTSPALSQCFGPDTTMTGQMNMQIGMSGMANSMTMTFTGNPSGGSVNNTLVMQGGMSSGMNSGSGTYTLTGNTAGCVSQSGVFTMTRQ